MTHTYDVKDVISDTSRDLERAEAARRGYIRTKRGAIRQKPGPGNSLGQMKVEMANSHAIYLHDTPSKSLFEREIRAFSHGCIRLGQPFDFAYALLAADPLSVPNIPASKITGSLPVRASLVAGGLHNERITLMRRVTLTRAADSDALVSSLLESLPAIHAPEPRN